MCVQIRMYVRKILGCVGGERQTSAADAGLAGRGGPTGAVATPGLVLWLRETVVALPLATDLNYDTNA